METKDRIRKFRERKGLSTTNLSNLTGISQSTISKIENGKRRINLELLEKIADALDVSVDRLTGEAASSIIEERLEEIDMTIEELSEKANVPLKWLKELDDCIPSFWGAYRQNYDWITNVALVLDLPSGQLRAAIARQEPPKDIGDGIKWVSDLEEYDHLLQDPLLALKERITILRKKYNYDQKTVADYVCQDEEIYSQIEDGTINPDLRTIKRLAKFYNCSVDFLTGISPDNPLTRGSSITYITDEEQIWTVPNLPELLVAPIIGNTRGGNISFGFEEIEGYMHVDPVIAKVNKNDIVYYLKIIGDSMTPKYQPGDFVLIRQQSTVINGEVAAVLIDNQEVCLKKVYVTNDDVWLHSTNPEYEPLIHPSSRVQILGKAMFRLG